MFDRDSFVNYVLYLHQELNKKGEKLYITKMYKLLWFASIYLAKTHGTLLMQDVFKKQDRGPVPYLASQYMEDIVDSGDSEGKIKVNLTIFPDGINHKIIEGLVAPDMDYISNIEKEGLDYVINKYGQLKAGELSELSHQKGGARDKAQYYSTINISEDKGLEGSSFLDDVSVIYNHYRSYARQYA